MNTAQLKRQKRIQKVANPIKDHPSVDKEKLIGLCMLEFMCSRRTALEYWELALLLNDMKGGV